MQIKPPGVKEPAVARSKCTSPRVSAGRGSQIYLRRLTPFMSAYLGKPQALHCSQVHSRVFASIILIVPLFLTLQRVLWPRVLMCHTLAFLS